MVRLPTSGWRRFRWRTCTDCATQKATANAMPAISPRGPHRSPSANGANHNHTALPGYLRIDTVHQGDQDGRKGLYHINAVDQVTQWEIVAATPQISELWLMPVLEALLGQFPFVIRGFHSDNGSEFINYNVAHLLDKLLIEQTKSRAHHTGDNGLVETKNGAIIRKHIGYGHIDAQHAEAMDQFHQDHLNPYLNFHRPCAVPKVLTENQRQAPTGLLAVGHSLRDVPRITAMREIPTAPGNAGGTGSLRSAPIRHRSRSRHAACQTQTLPEGPTETQRVSVGPRASRWSAIDRVF